MDTDGVLKEDLLNLEEDFLFRLNVSDNIFLGALIILRLIHFTLLNLIIQKYIDNNSALENTMDIHKNKK